MRMMVVVAAAWGLGYPRTAIVQFSWAKAPGVCWGNVTTIDGGKNTTTEKEMQTTENTFPCSQRKNMHFWDVDRWRWHPREDENTSVVSFEAKYSSVVKFVVFLSFTIIAHHVQAHNRKPHSRNVLFGGFNMWAWLTSTPPLLTGRLLLFVGRNVSQ